MSPESIAESSATRSFTFPEQHPTSESLQREKDDHPEQQSPTYGYGQTIPREVSQTRSLETMESSQDQSLDRRQSRSLEAAQQRYSAIERRQSQQHYDMQQARDNHRISRGLDMGSSVAGQISSLHRRESRRVEIRDNLDRMNRMHDELQDKYENLVTENRQLKLELDQERKTSTKKDWELQQEKVKLSSVQDELDESLTSAERLKHDKLVEELRISKGDLKRCEQRVEVVLECVATRDLKINAAKEQLEEVRRNLKARSLENGALINKLESVMRENQALKPIPKPKWIWSFHSKPQSKPMSRRR
jgi:hypothetical protein